MSVNSYWFKPAPVFEGEDRAKNLHMGFELEITSKQGHNLYGRGLDETADMIGDWEGLQRLIYCKHDGSIGNGIELVSHPRTLKWIMAHKENFVSLFEKLKEDFMNESNRCGLHIHCDRAFMNEPPYVGAKMALLVSRFWNIFKPISRRKGNSLRWCSKVNFYDTTKNGVIKKAHEGSRYVAVNTRPAETVEIRLWKSTLDVNMFLATLDLTQAIVKVAKRYSVNTIQRMSFSRILDEISYKENKDFLLQFLKKKHLLEEVLK